MSHVTATTARASSRTAASGWCYPWSTRGWASICRSAVTAGAVSERRQMSGVTT